MRGLRRRDVFGDSIAQPEQVDPREQALAGSEQDGRDGKVHLVHEARLQVLPDRGDAAAKPHVVTLGPPSFNDAKFDTLGTPRDVLVRMKY